MNTIRYVRELRHDERPPYAKTGDTLPDGSVVLSQRDMDRMGLRELRAWLSSAVDQGAAGIALADNGRELRLLDEEYNV